MRKAFAALALGFGVSVATVQAQSTPEDAARAIGEALRKGDWAATARLMHPDALRQLRTLFQPILAAPGMESIGAEVFGTQTVAEFTSLPDTVLFARFMKNVITRQKGMAEAISTSVTTPLGHVAPGADTVCVVTRTTMTVEGVTISEFEVMSFVQYRGQWRSLLKADVTNMAAMLQRAIPRHP